MKLLIVTGAEGEIVFQERVPDVTPDIYMSWPTPIYAQIVKLEIKEVKLKEG